MQLAGKDIQNRSWQNRIIHLVPVLILAGLFINIVHTYDLNERLVAMRYLLFGLSGIFAFILPYLSFPDPVSRIYQVGNAAPSLLMRSYMARHQTVWGTGGLLILITALADSRGITPEIYSQIGLLFYGITFLAGIYLYSACRYLRIGKDSQDWQEGVRGQEMRNRIASVAKYPIDAGSIPSLISSVLISLLGMMSVVAGAMVFGVAGMKAEAVVAVLLFLFGCMRYRAIQNRIDRFYYHTNAFFSEFFGASSTAGLEREPLKIDQLWWIPSRWKTHGWALMLQMDRKLPAGRYVAVGHLFIWAFAYQNASEMVMIYAWLIFAVMHHGMLLLTANQIIAPKWWLRNLDSPLHWILSRFWIQVRWLLPLGASMSMMKWFFAIYDWGAISLVLIVYLFTGAVVSIIISHRYEQYWAN